MNDPKDKPEKQEKKKGISEKRIAIIFGALIMFSSVFSAFSYAITSHSLTMGNAASLTKDAEKGAETISSGDTMRDIYYAANDLIIAPISAEHGEDYVIEWEDAGIEAHVRNWLDRPEGDIYHSDVWDYQYVSINSAQDIGADKVLKQPPEGWDFFGRTSIMWNSDGVGSYSYGSGWTDAFAIEVMPEIETLRDLRHFDSLQWLGVSPSKSLSGIEECKHLVRLVTDAYTTEMLAPIADMEQLQYLAIEIPKDGTAGLDAIEGLPNLQKLTIRGQPASWQPLATLPKLSFLQLYDCTNPDLEPLTATPIEYLDLSLSQGGTNYDELNYEPISRMEKLVYLDLTNNSNVQAADVQLIIDGAPDLQYLSIDYTPAAQHAGEIDASKLTVFKANIP